VEIHVRLKLSGTSDATRSNATPLCRRKNRLSQRESPPKPKEKRRSGTVFTIGPAILNHDILPINVAGCAQARGDRLCGLVGLSAA
jgi:hypothetical protein